MGEADRLHKREATRRLAREAQREVGFWRCLAQLGFRGLLVGPESLAALLFGTAPAVVLAAIATPNQLRDAAGDALAIVGALLGVVIAAFALVASLLSEPYLRFLGRVGVIKTLGPVVVSIGLLLASLVAVVAFRAAEPHLAPATVGVLFVAVATLVAFAVFDVMAVVRNFMMHAVLRTREVVVRAAAEEAERESS